MKKRNMVIMISCIIVCSATLLVILRGYHDWSEDTLNKLMYENQGAYALSQRAEVIARVEDVETSLKTMTAVLEQCGSEEEMHKFDSVMETMGETDDIRAEDVQYYSFKEIDTDIMKESDRAVFERLRKGKSVISNIYSPPGDDSIYYGVGEPVCLNGEYVGYVRGLISPDTLLYSNQTGIFRGETETYLIHRDGINAYTDFLEDGRAINMFDNLKEACREPEKIDKLRDSMNSGSDMEVVQITIEGKAVFVACALLPYNDWVILTSTSSDSMDGYLKEMTAEGRNTIITVISIAVFIMVLLFAVYYWNNKEQRFERKRAALLVNFSDTVLCEYDMKKDRINCTSSITKMFPIRDTTVEKFSKYLEERRLVFAEDMGIMEKILSEVPKEEEILEYQIRLRNKQDEYSWYEIHVTALYMNGRAQNRLILKISDIEEQKMEVMGLMQKARVDGLTGLLNRSAFRDKVEEEISLHKGGYLFMVDLDNFKQINDKFGHQCGDEVLRLTAECMKKCFRKDDYTGRYGGDEFLAFMSSSVSEEVAEERAKLLIHMINEVKLPGVEELNLSCSVGAVRHDDEDYRKLFEKADQVMYLAKGSGKNSWVLQ